MPRAPKTTGGAAKKSRAPKAHQLAEKFANGELLRDLCKKNWRLGDVIGQGGFGLIYLASDKDNAKVGPDAEYVVKIEPIGNGPLFCEQHFYQRVAKPEMINSWLQSHKLKYLGVPRFIAGGQHDYKGTSYRFLVMERFSTDLQKIFEAAGKQFSKQTVFALALRMLDALEYLHENCYIHADIKASNCLLGYHAGKTDSDKVYLVDFGLAAKYQSDGTHRPYKEDPRKAHDGTVEFTSIDAHKGVAPSRRGDMEILGYCLLQWLCGRLPWEDNLVNKDYVRDAKIKYMKDIPGLMKKCFPQGDAPAEITNFLKIVQQMQYEEKPNYNKMRDIFTKGLSSLGVKDTWKLELPTPGAKAKVTLSPKKGVKRPKSATTESPPKKAKLSPAKAETPKNTPKAKAGKVTKAAPPGAKATTPKAGGSRATTPKGRTAIPKTKPGTSRSPKAAMARKVGAQAASGRIGSPLVASPKETQATAKKKALARAQSPKGTSPAPKKRKVVRRKHIQSVEMACQTSPGLKKNS